MKAWINGRPGHSLDVQDRGLQYGDGVFETMCVRQGRVRLLVFHLERLAAGLRRLAITAPSVALLTREIRIATAGVPHAALKLMVTRGAGGRGYRAPGGAVRATRILLLYPGSAPAPARAERVRVCATRLAGAPALAGCKTLNRLDSVLARSEWRDPRIWEGLMLDTADQVVCGTMSNLFLRLRGTLLTPRLDRCGVAGVMRRWVLAECGTMRIRVREARIGWSELARAEEVFMSNALVGIRSVRRIEWRAAQRQASFEDFTLAERLRRRLEVL